MMGLFTFSHVRPIEDTFCALKRRVCGCMQSGPHTFTVFGVKGRRTLEESSICGFFIPDGTSIKSKGCVVSKPCDLVSHEIVPVR